MKKFSTITKQKAPGVKLVEKDANLDYTILEVFDMCESSLQIGVYGPMDTLLQANLKIEGIEDLTKIITKYVQMKQVHLLEEVKIQMSKGKDFKWIEEKIEQLKNA